MRQSYSIPLSRGTQEEEVDGDYPIFFSKGGGAVNQFVPVLKKNCICLCTYIFLLPNQLGHNTFEIEKRAKKVADIIDIFDVYEDEKDFFFR